MGLGALCPLPLRLGGSPEEGITASQFLRLATDLTAARRISPFAVLVIDQNNDDPVILRYYGQNGVGENDKPTIEFVAARTVITFKRSYLDGAGAVGRLNLRYARGGLNTDTMGRVKIDQIEASVVKVVPQNRAGSRLANAIFTLVVR